ncbi:MAG: DNA circularization N-terminal domain-containing protein [Desulfobulbaceae bacterium]|nr:DNA circularization N-terminal domain-containing protein [Desulfobulbaceae bacterium]
MGWREQLRPGSYRGIAFQTDSSDGDGLGRRLAEHSFPFRDQPYREDLGAKAKQWTVELFVLGPDYMAARDKLIAALDQPGAGKLVHPWLGTKMVEVVSARGPRETTAEGGMARFSVTFAEAGANAEPSTAVDTAANVDSKADAAIVAVEAGFADQFTVSGFPAFVAESAATAVSDALAAIDAVRDLLPETPAGAITFVSSLNSVAGRVASLIRSPVDLADGIAGLIGDLVALPSRPLSALRMCRALFSHGDTLPYVPSTTASRRQQAANQEAIAAMVRQVSAIEAARSVSGMAFRPPSDPGYQPGGVDNYNKVVEIRNEVADRLETEMETADDDTYIAMSNLRAAFIADINTRAATTPRVKTVTPEQTTPALVLAYREYDDASRDADIIARNDIGHPGFLPGGTPLEVLTDA